MGAEEWIYRYIFQTKYFRIAKVKKEFKGHAKRHKCHRFIFEYSPNGYRWTSKGLF